ARRQPARARRTRSARRARLARDPARGPGKRVPGARIDFQYGMASPPSLLRARWKRLLSRAQPFGAWGYPPAAGSERLRRALALHIARSRGVLCEPDDVLIRAGVP